MEQKQVTRRDVGRLSACSEKLGNPGDTLDNGGNTVARESFNELVYRHKQKRKTKHASETKMNPMKS